MEHDCRQYAILSASSRIFGQFIAALSRMGLDCTYGLSLPSTSPWIQISMFY